jgi:hypothetical protein
MYAPSRQRILAGGNITEKNNWTRIFTDEHGLDKFLLPAWAAFGPPSHRTAGIRQSVKIRVPNTRFH